MLLIRLTIGNSVSRIEGLGPPAFAEMKRALSYKVESNKKYFSGVFHIDYKSLLSKRGEFPTGLVYIVQEVLRDIPHQINDTRVRPRTWRGPSWFIHKEYEPYPEQAAAIALPADRGIYVAPTAYGKSIMAALLVDKFQVKTLIVVPTLALKAQLTASMVSWFGAERVKTSIRVENIDSIDASITLSDVDLLILDEYHHSASKTYRQLNKKAWKGVFWRFGLTATPFRTKTEEKLLLESILSGIICRITYQEAIQKDRVVPIEAYYVDVPNTTQCDSRNWPTVYSQLVVNNKPRNDLIVKIMTQLLAAKIPSLCLVKEIAHGEHLSEAIGCPFANGQDDLARIRLLEFNLGETTAMVGTVGVLGEGVDTKPAQYVVLAGAGKSKTQFMQNVGRAMRLYPNKDSAKIILLRDHGHKFLTRHFNECVRHLKTEYNVIPAKLEII